MRMERGVQCGLANDDKVKLASKCPQCGSVARKFAELSRAPQPPSFNHHGGPPEAIEARNVMDESISRLEKE